jgi:hypothetical protein
MSFERVEPERVLATRSEDGNWVWSFVLVEQDGKTRLISRNRFRLPSLLARVGMLPLEPASLVMERKMLRGIKQRAERFAFEGDEVPGLHRAEGTPRAHQLGHAGPRAAIRSQSIRRIWAAYAAGVSTTASVRVPQRNPRVGYKRDAGNYWHAFRHLPDALAEANREG